MTLAVLSRIGLFVAALIIGFFFFPSVVHNFVTGILGYQRPAGFFGFTFADIEVAWIMSSAFWVGILFSAIGKRIDYILILIFFTLASLDYYYTGNMTWLVYLGLVGATVLGTLVGVGLKLLRQRIWKHG